MKFSVIKNWKKKRVNRTKPAWRQPYLFLIHCVKGCPIWLSAVSPVAGRSKHLCLHEGYGVNVLAQLCN